MPSPRRIARFVAVCASVGAGVVAAAGCGGASGDAEADPATAVPANAGIYVNAVVRPEGDQKEAVDQFLGKVLRTDDPGKRIEELANRVVQEDAEAGDKPTYKDDVEPWLGDQAGFFLSPEAGSDEPTGTTVIAAKDTDKAADAIRKFSKDERKRNYRDTDYWVDSEGNAAGVVGDFVVGGEEAGFKSVVDATKGTSLSESGRYKGALEKAEDERIGFAYVDPRGLVRVLEGLGGAQFQGLGQIPGLRGSEPAVAVARAAPDAFSIVSTTSRRSAEAAGFSGAPGPELTRLPGDSFFALGGADLGKQFRRGFEQGAGAQRDFIERTLRQATGLTTRDIFDWMGDVTAYVRGSSAANLGVVVEVESTDQRASTEAITKLGRALRRQAGDAAEVEVERRPGGARVSVSGQGIPGPVQTVAEGDKVTFSYGRAGGGGGTLGDSPAFKQAAGKLGGQQPSLFVSVPPLLRLVESFGVSSDQDYQSAKRYLEALNYFIAGSKVEGDSVSSSFVVGVK